MKRDSSSRRLHWQGWTAGKRRGNRRNRRTETCPVFVSEWGITKAYSIHSGRNWQCIRGKDNIEHTLRRYHFSLPYRKRSLSFDPRGFSARELELLLQNGFIISELVLGASLLSHLQMRPFWTNLNRPFPSISDINAYDTRRV
jgi:hypothetical protein